MPDVDPKQLEEKFEAIATSVGSAKIMSREHKRDRESWCAARFVTGISQFVGPALVRVTLEDEQREFDFHLVLDSLPYPFQIVEVIDGGRRREAEYRNNSTTQLQEIFDQMPHHDVDSAAAQIKLCLEHKILKYRVGSRDLHLLMYLNLNVHSANWAAIAAACNHELPQFSSVWLLTQHSICALRQSTHWRVPQGWQAIDAES